MKEENDNKVVIVDTELTLSAFLLSVQQLEDEMGPS